MNKNIGLVSEKKCCGCQVCKNICPKKAISMRENKEGFLYPEINKDKCIDCGLCYKKCPIIEKTKKKSLNIAYACVSKDDELRLKSSSGGIWGEIAKFVLKNNGIVFGAVFSENHTIEHTYVDSFDDLIVLQGSKYVQSDINESYKNAENFLTQNRLVLFSGTPCQINGLLNFLGKEYKNLITIDVICHGVPSPKVWKKYLEYRKQIDGEIPNKISFRDKSKGWANFCMMFEYDKKSALIDHNKDLYMQLFLNNYILRLSCYKCEFKGENRLSDLTLGDFWGINKINQNLNDNKGISLLIVNSHKGKKIVNSLSNNLKKTQISFKEAINYNSALIKSVKHNPNREKFFNDLDNTDFEKLAKKYLNKTNLVKRIISKLKSIVRNIITKK